MPEYLAPGVFVEETSFRSKSIEGVSTSTTAFIGFTRRGPAASEADSEEPELLTSFGDFERVYGGLGDLHFAGQPEPATNHIAHAARAYFNEGGARLFVARVLAPGATAASSDNLEGPSARSVDLLNGAGGAPAATSRLEARIRGARGNGRALFDEVESPVASPAALAALPVGSVVRYSVPGVGGAPATEAFARRVAAGWVGPGGAAVPATEIVTSVVVLTLNVSLVDANGVAVSLNGLGFDPAHPNAIHRAMGSAEADRQDWFAFFNLDAGVTGLQLREAINGALNLPLTGGDVPLPQTSQFRARFVGSGGNGRVVFSETATPVPASRINTLLPGSVLRRTDGGAATHFRLGAGGWTNEAGAAEAPNGSLAVLTVNVTMEDADGAINTYEGLHYGTEHPRSLRVTLPEDPAGRDAQLNQLYWFDVADQVTAFGIRDGILGLPRDPDSGARILRLRGGADGTPAQGAEWDNAFSRVLGIEDVSILASPGYSAFSESIAASVQLRLIQQAETRRSYRIAVLEVPEGTTPTGAAEYKAAIDSKYAALYYPWVVVPNPLFNPNDLQSPTEITLPPTGFVCGIYARTDIERGVHEAPANEVVRSALRFERQVLNGEQELLNPLGVNCLRYFAGRGYRVWGARTTSSDPEWKYVNIRRYFLYLEHSIDRSTQWAVFKPNGERLWANIKETVTSFLYNEWVNGALLGTTPEAGFFVKCDRSTMTQNDLDNGRLICLVGVAAIKPAEFVIFRIGQKTADARS